MSLKNISLLNNTLNGANPCRETILNGLKKHYCIWKMKDSRKIHLSGNYGYG
jgi:hypothetical protein